MTAMKRSFIATSVALLFACQTTSATTLKQVVVQTVTNHPEATEVRANTLADYDKLKEAKGGFLPKLSLNLKRGEEVSDSTSLTANSSSGIKLWRQESTLSLNQMVYDGGMTSGRVENRESMYKAAKYKQDETKESLTLRVAEAYLNVLRFQKLLENAKANTALHKTIVEKTMARTESGLGQRADHELANARLSFAKTQLFSTQQQYNDAVMRYRILTGFDSIDKMAIPKTVIKKLPKNIDSFVKLCLRHNPSLKYFEALREAAKADVKMAHAAFIPHVDLEAESSRSVNKQGSKSFDENNKVMLVLSYTPYNGGADEAAFSAAKHKLGGAEDKVSQGTRNVRDQAAVLWHAKLSHERRVRELEDYVKTSQMVVHDYGELFKIGRQNIFQLLDAQKEMFQARAAQINENFDQIINGYRLLEKMGRLYPTIASK